MYFCQKLLCVLTQINASDKWNNACIVVINVSETPFDRIGVCHPHNGIRMFSIHCYLLYCFYISYELFCNNWDNCYWRRFAGNCKLPVISFTLWWIEAQFLNLELVALRKQESIDCDCFLHVFFFQLTIYGMLDAADWIDFDCKANAKQCSFSMISVYL